MQWTKKNTIDFSLPQSFPSPGMHVTAEQQQHPQNSLSPPPRPTSTPTSPDDLAP